MDKKKLFAVPAVLASVAPVAVFAEDGASGIGSITSGMTTGFTSIVSDLMSAVGSILPIVLPVMGAIAVIAIGRKIFKQVTGR